jgi:hypothetical protein
MLKALARVTMLLAIIQAPLTVFGQATNPSDVHRPTPSLSTPSSATSPAKGGPSAKTDCNGGPCEDQQPRIMVSIPAPAPVPWKLHDRIAWAANLVLVIAGFIGIILALSTLKKIERQTRAAEVAAEAAARHAEASLLSAQALRDAERPWLLISVEPSPSIANSFTVIATNRGRTPAQIVSTAEQIRIAIDESRLSCIPEYQNKRTDFPLAPIILLPGESAAIKPFCREDLKGLCQSDEALRRIEDWEDKVYLFGKVVYKDLIERPDKQIHETAWCCWYIHGRRKSGLVIAGPPNYNQHT